MKSTLAISAVVFTLGIVTLPVVFSDTDHNRGSLQDYAHRFTGVATVSDAVYSEECGSCHMAYPAGLLPARSWSALMTGLDDHFGDNAELNDPTRQHIIDFLLANSADRSNYRRSQKFAASIASSDTPVRITQTPYFRREHHEIPARLVGPNAEVKSFSQCNACHADAEKGSFNEHDINIPGVGRWDD